jgi:hypothetical protein
MDAVTYPDDLVARFINANLIPLRVKSDSMLLSKDFNITWTPTLITLDRDGKEHYRTVAGFKSTHDGKMLKAAYEKLQEEYPGSQWADRAQPYRFLK